MDSLKAALTRASSGATSVLSKAAHYPSGEQSGNRSSVVLSGKGYTCIDLHYGAPTHKYDSNRAGYVGGFKAGCCNWRRI